MTGARFINAVFFLLFFLLCRCSFVAAQSSTDPNSKQINIIHADTLTFRKLNDTTNLKILKNNVAVQQQNTKFYCDSAILNERNNTMEAFGHVHINNADSVNTYADYLRYLGNDKTAYLRKNVRLTDGKGTLTTPELDYNTQTKIGIYRNGGKLVNGPTTLTSDEGYYYGQTRDATFKKHVVLINPDYHVTTDTLLYNTYTNIATFTVPTKIVSGQKVIHTSNGYYNLSTKQSYFGSRSAVQDSTSFLIADELASEDSTGNFQGRGNAIYRDTAQGYALFANDIKGNRKQGVALATQHPVMMFKQNGDSLFIAADTLFTAKLSQLLQTRKVPAALDSAISLDSLLKSPKDSSKDRYVEAYYHVRIFSDSLQATGDSLFYSAADSVFRFFKNPIVWSNNSQITGDTIYLFTQNKKPQKVNVFENALAISDVDSTQFFNQIKGRIINGLFKDGEINFIHTQGNAESVYYAQDDNRKFIGVDKSSCDAIDTYFRGRKPDKISRLYNLKGVFYPMQQVNHEELKLRGFTWQNDKRPKSREELFGK